MKITRIYESYTDLAEAMTDGDGILHGINCPGADGCLDWQKGVLDFAGWLDHIKVKVKIKDTPESFYEYIRRENESRTNKGAIKS